MSVKSNFAVPAVAALCLSFTGGTTPAHADLGDQLFKLLAVDEGGFDNFGGSVAIRGATAIIGAERDRDYGTEAGSAYLFDTTTGQQIVELRANDVAPYDSLGWSVAISGTTAIVGAPGHDHVGTGKSSAYLFDIITGKQIAELLPGDVTHGNGFGWSVAISQTTAILGAWTDDNYDGTDSGAAYLFDISNPVNPIQGAKLLADDGAHTDRFGWSVAISGTTVIVGAYRHTDNGTEAGSAYLFDTATGKQIAKLLPDDGAAHDRFGYSVGISGNTAIVGAYQDDDNGQSSGSAYLFDTATGRQLFKLLPDDGAEAENFGYSVGISGAIAIVGARRDDDNGHWSGSAYLFDTASGRQLVKLLPDDGDADDTFGVSVAISGPNAIVGAEEDDDNGGHSGSAYLFDATTVTTTTTPDSFDAFRGFLASGTLADLRDSDDSYLCHEPGKVINPTEAPITLTFVGTLPNDSPATLDVTIESSANTVGLELTISFWNYNTNSWDIVGTDTQSLNVDTVRTFAGVPADHVGPGTGVVATLYQVRQVSFIFLFPWRDCIDHLFWTTIH